MNLVDLQREITDLLASGTSPQADVLFVERPFESPVTSLARFSADSDGSSVTFTVAGLPD